MTAPLTLPTPLRRLDPTELRTRHPAGLRPWTSPDLIRTTVCNAIGLLLIVASWYQASGQTLVRAELTWFELGLVGVAVAGAGNALWLLNGRRQVGLARIQVLPGTNSRPERTLSLPHRSAGPGSAELVSAPNMTRYHRSDCPLVAGKPVKPILVRQPGRAKRTPCELCEPPA